MLCKDLLRLKKTGKSYIDISESRRKFKLDAVADIIIHNFVYQMGD